MRKLIVFLVLALLATGVSSLPVADRPLEVAGLESFGAQPADAATDFICFAVGAGSGKFVEKTAKKWWPALIATYAVATICSVQHYGGTTSLCADTVTTHNGIYGTKIQKPSKTFTFDRACPRGTWQANSCSRYCPGAAKTWTYKWW